MDKEKSRLQQIAKLSDIIRNKYKQIKYNKISDEDDVKKVFKPVIEPLQKLVDISNDKTQQSNVEIKLENDKIKQENDMLKNNLYFKHYYDQDSDYNNATFKTPNITTHENKTFDDFSVGNNDFANDQDDLNDYGSVMSDAATSKSNYQLAFDKSMNDNSLETKKDNFLQKVIDKDKEIDLEVGVRTTQPGKFMFGNKQIKFSDDNFIIQNKSYNLTDGLLELLFKKEPNASLITSEDYDIMKEIIPVTQVHRKNYWRNGELRINNSKINNHLIFCFDKYSKTGKGLFRSKKIAKNLSDYMIYNNNKINYIYFNDINEIVDRLRLLIASQTAGNNNHTNKINSILEELRENNVIF